MTDNRKYEMPMKLDMGYEEALQRTANTDPKEILDITKQDMDDGSIEGLIDAFEACSYKTDDGQEFWYARDLQKLFDYGEFRFFKGPLDKAVIACKQSGKNPNHHFVQVHDMVGIGSGATRQIDDMQMSRYACYLTAQNCDAKKKPVAFAQTYFAIQTRRQEVTDLENAVAVPLTEDEKRVYLRNQIKEHNRYLSSAAKEAGVITPLEFAIFHSKGYQGLYGKNVGQIRRHKGLAKSVDILDRMGSTELAANFFRVTQTEEKLRKEKTQGKDKAYKTHYEVGRQVRDAMLKISGIAPEDLPAVDSIKQAEKRLKIQSKATPPIKPQVPASIVPKVEKQTPIQPPIDLRRDLWKYSLLVLVQQPAMEMLTSDLIAELPNYVTVPETVEQANESRGDSKFSQLVRNLKSHKSTKSNFIYQGYAESIPRGFRATEKGKAFVIDYFKDRM